MHEVKAELEEISAFIEQGLAKVNLEGKRKRLDVLEAEMGKADFWDNNEKAAEVGQEASGLKKAIETWEGIKSECDELTGLLSEISPEKDPKGAKEFKEMVAALVEKWRALEIQTFLSGKYDANNAIISIHAGTGGTDAQDFAEMLMRMYLRYAERMGFQSVVMDKSNGDEAGVKSCTFMVSGEFAYGYLKGESGIHRLVRLSPFNSKHTRETSFVLVDVLPEIHFSDDVKIADEDLRIDVFRAGGHGGQSVNTTDSAVRITHIPTGIVVSCQNERSQAQNKEFAMKVLHSRLLDLMERQQTKEISELRGETQEIAWGNQIRSYVLHPYKMVKDHRTDYEEGNPDKILDGKIDGFVKAELKKEKFRY